jgi:hypothetical protein
MWPFTSRRIFGSRWWALGFVAFVCWQVADLFDTPASSDSAIAAPAVDTPIDNAQMQQMADTLNALNSVQQND